MVPLLERCRRLTAGGAPSEADLHAAVASGDVSDAELAPLLMPAPFRPYGRNVFLDAPGFEAMIATWSRAYPCAPHDHGGSIGVVRVLRGAATHRTYALADGELRVTDERRVLRGQVIACAPDVVHSMVDAADPEPLVTLHLYAAPIDRMVVYDMAARRTLVVHGQCGAWVPTDAPHLVRDIIPGLVARPLLLAEVP
jgi:cysteine dioxygenase